MSASGNNPLSHVLPHPIETVHADLGPLTPQGQVTLLSDQIVMMIVAGLLLMVAVPMAIRRRRSEAETGKFVLTGFGNGIEAICTYFRDEVARPALGVYTDRFIKYIWSVFFFILTINLLGLLPIATISPALFGVHIGGTATGNIWVTSTLALLTLILMVFNGLRLGGVDYLKHFMPGPAFLAPLMIFLEVVGLISKTVALALRLFANMVAGHILVAVLISLILTAGQALGTGGGLAVGAVVVAGSVAVFMLEIFVAFLQAFIFTYLTTLFIGMSVNVHHDHEEAAAH